MSHSPFIHLRVHTTYSLSEGAIRIPELVALCRNENMPAVAITDTNNLFGALAFAEACREAGIQPIIGCQVAVDTGRPLPTENGVPASFDQLVLLVQNETGYRNLLDLVSASFVDTDSSADPHVTIDQVASRASGLICLTAGPAGPLGSRLQDGQVDAAEDMLLRLKGAFGDRLYIEIMRHGLECEDAIESALVELAYRHELPLVATNEVFFGDAAMYEAHDALVCIAGGAYVDQADRRRLTPDHRFRSADDMRAVFADMPEALDNTLVIARRCAFMPEARAPILPAFPTIDERDEGEELARRAKEALESRLEANVYTADMDAAAREAAGEPYRQRLSYELEIILGMGFPGYFLIVADFIGWAKEKAIPVGPGRGSGAGSVVAWALGITDLDPLRWGLLFERFLNPERISMPDFDVDFCQERRDEVIHYVQERYGRENVAQIITFGTLQARAALRDVGRVLRMPYGQIDRICKLVPNNPANPVKLQQAIDDEPQLQEMRREDETVARLINIALKLEGLHRHASTHAAGLVIGDRPLKELIPLYRDPRSDMPVTQFDMKWAEKAGLVKFDFLGLKTLSVLSRTVELLSQRGVEVDLARLPLDDAATYAMLSRGESTGVFQMEGSGMRDTLRRLRPDRFEDLIAVVALYRPGPMNNIPRYIACKHGEETPDYLDPSLEPILKETFGIMIYQEQVMQIAQVLCGFSLGHADVLRRAMGKKQKAEMAAQRKAFIDGAAANGVDQSRASQIFDQVDKFAGYGFNKSHAAAYALVAYQTAWLKANHPVEFMAALMSFDLNNTDKLAGFRQEVGRLGIPMRPPDINRSEANFTVEDEDDGGVIRYALAALKNVGAQAVDAVVAERQANGPFKDLADLAGRLDNRVLNKRLLESLAASGALEPLMTNRRRVYEGVETVLRHANAAANDRHSNQHNLFGGNDNEAAEEIPLPDVEDWPVMDRLKREFEAVGYYLSAHPLDAYGKGLQRLDVLSSRDLIATVGPGEGKRIKMAGTIIGRQERTSARGNRFAFVQLSDPGGDFEVTVFSEILASARDLLDSGDSVLVTIDARHEDDQVRLLAQGFESLDHAAARTAAGLVVYLDDEAVLPNLASVIDRQEPGRGRVHLILDAEGREVDLLLENTYQISAATRAAIKSIPGIVEVRDI
ncbi:MAG: DNA polymerase III subunit alpha [Alphaproteobacteria bacterium]|nr:DNA polymerase III subunit alpha [Alphaproteobacteria bacterium]